MISHLQEKCVTMRYFLVFGPECNFGSRMPMNSLSTSILLKLFIFVQSIMELWTSQHRSFVIETFFKSNESVITTQRAFRRHFSVSRLGDIPKDRTILRWVENFIETGSSLKKKPTGKIRSVRTPHNIERIRETATQSPHCLALRHAAALRLSDCSLRWILHLDLKFHPSKIAIVH
jgi:hypothetical protein